MSESVSLTNDSVISRMEFTTNSLGSIWFYFLLHLIILFFVLVAIFNICFLYHSLGVLILSAVWLFIVFAVNCTGYKEEGGMPFWLINRGGEFVRRHFAEVIRDDSGQLLLCFGYQLFGRSFYLLKLKWEGIISVDWGAGQATSMAGRDMKDWHVCLWFHPDSAVWNGAAHKIGIYIVGLYQPREMAEVFGDKFIAFLRKAGMDFGPIDTVSIEEIVGGIGIVSENLTPVGKIILDGKEYPARSWGYFAEKGDKVEILEKRGLLLVAKRTEAENAEDKKSEKQDWENRKQSPF